MNQQASSTRLGKYLRRLRENYGYTLRRVQQRSRVHGECIDNSQLSRFEKGKSFPSFEKLRILAKVFNIPVQNFSDMLDLEMFDRYKPDSVNYDHLMELGSHEFEHGNFGKAYVVFERCLEVVGHGRPDDVAERRARARSRMAIALKKLGKLTMTESELRSILRDRAMISPQTQIRTLLQLASVNRERGDRYLAGIIAHECLDLARQENDRPSEAAACQILGNVRFEEGDPDSAVREFETALEIWKSLGDRQKKITALATLGDCYSARGENDPGWTALREALSLARELSDRRGIAYALHKMGVVCLREDRVPESQDYIARSNLEADRGPERYFDILFANTYHLWEQARHNGNGTQAKIAFGRLKHLRPEIERRMPEREKFDQYLRRSQDHAD